MGELTYSPLSKGQEDDRLEVATGLPSRGSDRHERMIDSDLSYFQPPSLARRSLQSVQGVLGHTALGPWYAKRCGYTGAVILVYHSIANERTARWIDPAKRQAPSFFKRQMQFLARHRNVVPLGTVVDALEEGDVLPPGTVSITFDDGYRDNLSEAFPILAAFNLPATVFVPTRHIDDREPPWINRLYTAIVYRRRQFLKLSDPIVFSGKLSTSKECSVAYREISRQLVLLEYEARKDCLTEIAWQLGADPIPCSIGMNWSDVRESLARFPGVEFGSHTVTHMDMSRSSPEAVDRELIESKASIESALDRSIGLFAYPYSRVGDGDERRVAAAGYQAAFSGAEATRIQAGCSVYRIPRSDAPRSMGQLALLTSGAFPEISLRLLGHA